MLETEYYSLFGQDHACWCSGDLRYDTKCEYIFYNS